MSRSKDAIKHKQFTSPAGAVEIFSTGAKGSVYGFLIEEPKDDPLFLLLIDGTSSAIKASYSAENNSKFGRDAQDYAMHFFPAGLDIALSTSRTSISAPNDGATIHIYFSSMTKNS